jgi:DNA-binding beta-propeller fold protein YncE
MRFTGLGRALLLGMVAALLAGCGGTLTGGPVPRGSTAIRVKAHKMSGSSGDLLYVSNLDYISVFTYPQGTQVGTISNQRVSPAGLCSDDAGDVFVTNYEGSDILEYSHGGTEIIQTLEDGGYHPNGCAIDPLSGTLAVANQENELSHPGSIAIYSHAQGAPTFYTAPNMQSFDFCTYDDKGNLFFTGSGLGELTPGSDVLKAIKVKSKSPLYLASIQWDGKHLAVTAPYKKRGPLPLYRLKVTGSSATVVGETRLVSKSGRHNSLYSIQYWIEGTIIVGQNGRRNGGLGFWRYPRGGKPTLVIKSAFAPYGETVSIAPSRK